MNKFPPKKKTSDMVKPREKHEWSSYQKAIFKNIHAGQGNTIVIARAGSSKSTSLIEGSRYIPKGKKTLFCAFGKNIQEELQARLPSYVDCMTLHSLGFRAVKQRFGQTIKLDNRKCFNIVQELVDNKEEYDLINSICQAVSLCKATLTDTPTKIIELLDYYNIDLCGLAEEEFMRYIVQALRLCKEKTDTIDYDDMVWFCFVYRLNPGKWDYVLIDEGQDLSKSQIELALSTANNSGRIIAVLDDRQAIFGWRGADSTVLDNLRTKLNPIELTLPICYRCPQKVVRLAQTLVPDIIPFEKSPEGEIINLHINELKKNAKPGCFVLSRYNAPLIKHCLAFLRDHIPANILGRDIGVGLLSLIKKSKKKKVVDLLKWLNEWEKNEREAYLAKYSNRETDFITDKAECIRMLCEDIATVEEAKKNIEKLFNDENVSSYVCFATPFRAKGMERDEVFVLTDTLRGGNEMEINVQYVSFTRAKKKLYLMSKFPERNPFYQGSDYE